MGWALKTQGHRLGDVGGVPALGFSEPGSSPHLTQPVGHLGLRDSICDLGAVTLDTVCLRI